MPLALSPAIGPAARLSGQFTLIIDGLCQAVAARAPRQAAAPLLVLLWTRLRRLAARFARLVEHAAAGTLPVRRPGGAGAECAKRERAKRGLRLPDGYAWLLRLVPEAASYGSQLQHWLSQPEMATLIASVPRAGRMVAPLARMLAVDARPKLPRPAKTPAPATPASMTSALPPAPLPDIECPASGFLPSGVPYWARNAWPGHDYAGRDPPRRLPAAAVKGGAKWDDSG